MKIDRMLGPKCASAPRDGGTFRKIRFVRSSDGLALGDDQRDPLGPGQEPSLGDDAVLVGDDAVHLRTGLDDGVLHDHAVGELGALGHVDAAEEDAVVQLALRILPVL